MELEPDQARHGLTVLTRLAQRSAAGERQLARLLDTDPDKLAVPAAEVAIECGEPIAGLLAGLLRSRPVSTETLLTVRSLGVTGELGLLVHELLAGQTLSDPHLTVEVLVGLASRLMEARRADDALDAANRAVAMARSLPVAVNETGLLRALDVLSRIHTAFGEHEAASQAITEAVSAAEQRLSGLAEPYLGVLLLTQADQLRRAGHVQQALAAYTRAAGVWREVHSSPDLDLNLLMGRLTSGSIHIAVGRPAANVYEGPMLGSYRMNAVLAEDGQIYVGPRHWSPTATRVALATALRERGRTLLLLAEPDKAATDLRDAVVILTELHGTANYHLADAEFVLAHCLQWTNQVAEAAEAAGRAVDLFDDAEQLLAENACGAVAEGLGRGQWIRYFEQLVALGRTRQPADGGQLLTAVAGELHRLAVTLKNDDLAAVAIPLLRLVIDTSTDPAQQAVSLVSLANAELRLDDTRAATASARQAVALAPPQPVAVASAYHALARCLSAARQWDEARNAQYRAASSILPALATAPVVAIDVLHAYVLAAMRLEGTRVMLPSEFGSAVVDLLSTAQQLPERSAVALAEIGFSVVSQAARERDLVRTRDAYRAFLAFTHRHSSPETRSTRAVLGWNVAMCFVDSGDMAAAQEAVDDVAALVAEEPDNDEFVVEHAKTASELVAAYWNGGAHDEARAVVRAASGSLRSPQYLATRQRDIGQPPADFLATLDMIEQQH